MRSLFPERRLASLAAVPITNGLGEAAADGDADWPRYIRTTDIAGLFELDAEKRVTLPPIVARGASVFRGDILMTAAGSLGTSYEHVSDESACYAGYLVRFRANPAVTLPRYISYWTRSMHHLSQIEQGAVRSTIDNFSASKFRSMRVPLPPLREQQRIADFLDDQVARINVGITSAEQLEQRAVDRSQTALDDLFDGTGRRVRCKELLRQFPQYGVLVPQLVDEGVPFVRIKDLTGLQRATPSSLAAIPTQQSVEYRRTVLRAGDVLVGVVGSTDKAAIVPEQLAGANIARAVARLVPASGVPSLVLLGWLGTTAYRRQAAAVTDADTAQPTLNMGDLRNFHVPLPRGSLPALAQRIEQVQSWRQDGIAVTLRLRQLLEERKRALVTACVTGEFDVTTASDRASAAAVSGTAAIVACS